MEKSRLTSGCSKARDAWESGNNFKFDKDYPYGYPWPPRYYTCSFCQREFKSAQALGGHMNIHRRDRARLREQSPNNNPLWADDNSSDHQNPSPKLNPNYPSPSNSTFAPPSPTNNTIYAHQYSLVSLSLSSQLPPTTRNGEKLGAPFKGSDEIGKEFQGVGKWKDFSYHHDNNDHEFRVLKSTSTKELVKLDLELCLGEAKEDLDLELRLGI